MPNLGSWAAQNLEGLLMKVRSVVKYFAEDTVLQAVGSKLLYMYHKLYICEKRVLGDPCAAALESLTACWCSLLKKLTSLIFFLFFLL